VRLFAALPKDYKTEIKFCFVVLRTSFEVAIARDWTAIVPLDGIEQLPLIRGLKLMN
jgi:hypothetical protein